MSEKKNLLIFQLKSSYVRTHQNTHEIYLIDILMTFFFCRESIRYK